MYSRHHNWMDPDTMTNFWQFSFTEMGDYDIPATVDYILKATGRKKLALFGYSQGTTVCFYSLATHKEFFREKINIFVSIAPVITMKYAKSDMLRMLSGNGPLLWTLKYNNYLEIFPKTDENAPKTGLMEDICNSYPDFCVSSMNAFADTNPEFVNQDRVNFYMAHFYYGTSLKNIIHMGQILQNGKFQLYDYEDEDDNMQAYG